MIGILPLSVVGSLHLVDVAVGAHAVGEVGRAPLVYDGPAETVVGGTLNPFVAGRYRDRRGGVLLRYGPRWRRQSPQPPGAGSVFLMHEARLSADWLLDRRTAFEASTDARYGEVAYANFTDALGPEQPTELRLARLRFGSLDARLTASHALSRRYMLQLGAELGLRRSLEPAQRFAYPDSTVTRVFVTPGYRVNRRDTVSTPVAYAYLTADPGVRAQSFSSSVAWSRRLSRSSEGTLQAGATYVRQALPAGESSTRVTPLFMAGYSTFLARTWHGDFSLASSAALRSTVDEVRGDFRPIASLTVSVSYLSPPWRAVAAGGASATATREPLERDRGQSVGTARLVVSREVFSWLDANAGIRGSVNTGHWSEEPVVLRNRQGWLFVGVSGAFGTGNDDGAWAR